MNNIDNKEINPFETLAQYAIERDDFERIYLPVVKKLCYETEYETDYFKGWYNNDEWYILHKRSGTMINWYKHCGRCNTCNKTLSLHQHEIFANMIYEDMLENNIGE